MLYLYSTIWALLVMVAAGALFWFVRNQNREKVMPRQMGGDDNQLHALIEGTIGETGESLFYALAREVALYLEIDSVFVASCEDSGVECYRTHAYWCDDGYVMNQNVSLSHCPSGSTGGFWNLENSASDMFPKAELFRDRFRVLGFSQCLCWIRQVIG
jgi:hypothetical protein